MYIYIYVCIYIYIYVFIFIFITGLGIILSVIILSYKPLLAFYYNLLLKCIGGISIGHDFFGGSINMQL